MNRRKEEKAFRTTLSFAPAVYAKARKVMEARDFNDFSGFIQQLIREEWERRNTVCAACAGSTPKQKDRN